jgi:hypothetical protein
MKSSNLIEDEPYLIDDYRFYT